MATGNISITKNPGNQKDIQDINKPLIFLPNYSVDTFLSISPRKILQ